ncbi:hypothetical protein GTQ99_08950 [Kineococcus sp. T13]|uniref:hypothetical protein n=1 Tax=Kineococcus vitellinus TaxID=2696565 RepID=UPI0014133ACD|nr:hypothetical protein [Kineococcus vitellinus]NAZ75548.1 hypothetical protein [Kineococcus vitellinus]
MVVIGSQSILGSYDEDDLPDPVIGSVEADVTFWNDLDDRKSDAVDGAIGEDSGFHQTYGYYAQGVSITTAVLPDGWRERVVVWENRSSVPGRAHCLEAHDLAVAKLVAARMKDYDFVSALIDAGLVSPTTLRERAETLPPPRSRTARVLRWLDGHEHRPHAGR